MHCFPNFPNFLLYFIFVYIYGIHVYVSLYMLWKPAIKTIIIIVITIIIIIIIIVSVFIYPVVLKNKECLIPEFVIPFLWLF